MVEIETNFFYSSPKKSTIDFSDIHIILNVLKSFLHISLH